MRRWQKGTPRPIRDRRRPQRRRRRHLVGSNCQNPHGAVVSGLGSRLSIGRGTAVHRPRRRRRRRRRRPRPTKKSKPLDPHTVRHLTLPSPWSSPGAPFPSSHCLQGSRSSRGKGGDCSPFPSPVIACVSLVGKNRPFLSPFLSLQAPSVLQKHSNVTQTLRPLTTSQRSRFISKQVSEIESLSL